MHQQGLEVTHQGHPRTPVSGLGSHLLPEHLGQPARGMRSHGAPLSPLPAGHRCTRRGQVTFPVCPSAHPARPHAQQLAERETTGTKEKKGQKPQESCLPETLQEARGDLAPMHASSPAAPALTVGVPRNRRQRFQMKSWAAGRNHCPGETHYVYFTYTYTYKIYVIYTRNMHLYSNIFVYSHIYV